MRLLRMALVLGLVVAASACGDDDSTTTTVEPTVATTAPVTRPDSTDPTQTTQATTPPTTEPPTSATTIVTTEPTPEPTATTTGSPAATTTTTGSPAVTTTEPPMLDVKVYFVHGERLAIAHRQVPGPAILRGALTQLLEGPTAAERAAGYATTIPDGTTLLDLNLAGGIATVDLSDQYDDGGGSLMMMARVAQVVFTATQFDNSGQVVFWMDGEPIDYLGGEGIELAGPQSRSSTQRSLTGGILIDTPDPGATVTSPFTVTGEGRRVRGRLPDRDQAQRRRRHRTVARVRRCMGRLGRLRDHDHARPHAWPDRAGHVGPERLRTPRMLVADRDRRAAHARMTR